MKIALASPKSKGRKAVPNGIRILGGIILEKKLGNVEIFDGSFYKNQEELINAINRYSPNVLGVSCFADNTKKTLEMLDSCDADYKIVGGPNVDAAFLDLNNRCDAVFSGESEKMFEDYISNPSKFKGKIKTDKIRKIQDLDSISIQGWSLIDKYFDQMSVSPYWHLKDDYVNLLTSRGCYNHCTFCLASKLNGGRVRYKSVDKIESEIDFISRLRESKGLPPLKSIVFDDPDFFSRDESSLLNLFWRLKERNITYGAFASIDNCNENLLKNAGQSGLKSLLFGIETHEGNRKHIGRRKKFSDKQARKVLELCRQNDIFTSAGYIIGFPWETKEDIQKTIECMDKLPVDYPGISVLDVYPGTPIERYGKNNGFYHDGDFSYDNIESLNSRMSLPSPHPKLSRNYLKKKELETYEKVYNPQRMVQTLNVAKSKFDKEKVIEMYEQRETFIKENEELLNMEKKK